jgi:hypothetical protein
MPKKKSVPEAIKDHSDWVDELLNLFLVVDECVKGHDYDLYDIPEPIRDAYRKAEAARQQL